MMRAKSIAAIAGLLASALVLASCATGDHDAPLDHLHGTESISLTEPSLTYPPQLDVDARNPESVAVGTARVLYGWRISTDDAPSAAVDRATPLLSAALADSFALIRPEPTVNPRVWADWQQAHASARVRAEVAPEEHPADTEAQWERKIAVTIVVTDRARRVLWSRNFAVSVTAQRQAGAWLVSAFTPLGI